ncbi:MAG: aminomethyltransferase family protein [Terriglobia bacterium]
MSTPPRGMSAVTVSSSDSSSDEPRVLYHGAELASWYSSAVNEHHAVRQAAGVFDFSFRAMFSAKGNDRARFLHSMTTNDVKGLAPGQGLYATLLDVRGHILADVEIYCEEDQFLVTTDADLLDKVLAVLGRYNIGGRVPLESLPLTAISIQGPNADGIVRRVLATQLPGPDEYRHSRSPVVGKPARVIKAGSTGEEGYQIWAASGDLPLIADALLDAGRAQGLIRCGCAALETLRIEAGIPKYGSELGEDTLPLEAGIMNALSFNKGCYIGQEIVERARSRGRVNWKLAGLFIDSPAVPAVGETVLHQEKAMGEITSACVSPTLGRTIALGYVRREIAEPGSRVVLGSGAAAEVAELPFYRRPA